jgi:hypothetical protein
MTVTSGDNSASIVFGTNTGSSAEKSSTLEYPIAAPWLADVQRRLSNSIGLASAPPSGQWLDRNIVSTANTFFQATSDLLPVEPYLYSSKDGELIAEFKGAEFPLTLVVSHGSAVAISLIQGRPLNFAITVNAAAPNALRSELKKITAKLRAQHHGTVETAS